MTKKKKQDVLGLVLFYAGLAGLVLPHLLFLLKIVTTLDMPSHSYFEVAIAGVIWWGMTRLMKGRIKK